MSSQLLLVTASQKIHLSAVTDYFDRNPNQSPESIALELEHVRDTMIHAVPDTTPLKDVQATHKFLGDLIIMFREM